jgi:hypothetical protein
MEGGDAMDGEEVREKLKADDRERRWAAMREVDACAKALGNECEKAIGISYQALHLILARLAAAVGAGKCDGGSPSTSATSGAEVPASLSASASSKA